MVLSLALHEAHVWVAKLGARDPPSPSEFSILDHHERRRAERFVLSEARFVYVRAHAFLRHVLSRYATVEPGDWRFQEDRYGRPELVRRLGVPSLRFNLSHTRGLVAIVVALDRDVGVDAECVERRVELMRIAEHFFTSHECTVLRSLPHDLRCERIIEYWTLKEAYVKARGLGLAIPLDHFSFEIEGGHSVRIAFSTALADDPVGWHFVLLRPTANHRVAVALRRHQGEQDLQVIVRA